MVGGSGLGKTTIAVCVANEMGTRLFQVQAPVSFDTLMSLRKQMQRGDILFVDEIHLQAIQERRGKEAMTQPEVFFNVMEDRTIVTPSGVLPFPEITVIGATTDEGMLPDPFINRFPIRPPLTPYLTEELMVIAAMNAELLDTGINRDAAELFADASRGTPRVINNYIKNAVAQMDTEDIAINMRIALNVLDANGVTDDGLTRDMQNVLTFLYTRAKHTTKSDGEVRYQASVSTIATAIGKSRDQKAVQLRIEPYLIEKGFLQVGHGGRKLTDLGIERAKELLEEA
jgi:Holliday junction DNA helicase RuvB